MSPDHGADRPDLAAERIDYAGAHLLEADAPPNPYDLFSTWLAGAFEAKERGVLPEPTAMVVATVVDDQPSSRTVLLKDADEDGFVFYTNYDSRKGREVAAHPAVALLFGWYPLQRQVRIEGRAVPVPRAESEAYFATRPRGSQLGAWASAQSSELQGLEELQQSYAAAEQRFAGGDVPCPERWGGFRVAPETIEFWQGQPSRLHDRLLYRRLDHLDKGWKIVRLAP